MGIEAKSKPWFVCKIIWPSQKQAVQNKETSGLASEEGSTKKIHLVMKKTLVRKRNAKKLVRN